MPTFAFIKNSKEVHRFSGSNAALLEETIIKHASAETFTGSGYTLNTSNNTSTTSPSSDGIGGWLGSFMSSVTGSSSTTSISPSSVSEDEETKMNQNYEQQANEIFPVDKNEPTCKMQVRLLDGKKLTVIMNNTQKVEQLREYITVARPAYADIPFALFTGHPAKAIEDEVVSLEHAKLANAVVVVQLKK